MERGHEIKVLDHGYVRLVDYMGSDEAIVEAARMSTGRGFVSWEPYRRCKKCDRVAGITKDALIQFGLNPALVEQDRQCGHFDQPAMWQDFPRGDFGILDYLYRMGHTSPFEMCELVIDIQVPMDHWRQWIRNRTASVNEYSTRYSEAINLMAATLPGEWRTQGASNRQGSGEYLPEIDGEGDRIGAYLSTREKRFHEDARKLYEERLSFGVAKEQARKDLPLSTYTAARWKIDLHNLLHNFLAKRMHGHAQIEIRSFANVVAQITKALWPRAYALYEEYTLYGAHLSCTEKLALADVVKQVSRSMLNEMLGDKEAAALLKKLGVQS